MCALKIDHFNDRQATSAKAKLHPNRHVQHDYCYDWAPFRLIHQTFWLEITAGCRAHLSET